MVYELDSIRFTPKATGRPQTNKMVERENKTILGSTNNVQRIRI